MDAALYYLGIMIEANDMDSIERRLLVTAYEDIGLGNPAAVARCVQAIDAAKRVGFPEGRIPLAMAIIDLCLSPKPKVRKVPLMLPCQYCAILLIKYRIIFALPL